MPLRSLLRGIILAALVFHASGLHADVRSPFKDKNIRNIFEDRDDGLNASPEIQYFPPVEKIDDFPIEEKKEAPVTEPVDPKEKIPLGSAEEIIEKYGDPGEIAPVLGKTDAPKPFQGMMQALHLGNRALAFQYAKQWARYLRDYNERTSMTVGLIGKAMEVEGIEDGEGWTSAKQYDEFNDLRDQDLAQKQETQEKAKLMDTNDQYTRELFQRASAGDKNLSALFEQKQAEPSADNLRKEIRAKLAHKVPVDPKGRVDIYFFFDLETRASVQMGKKVEAIYQRSQADDRINFIGLTLKQETEQNLKVYRLKTRTTFPVINGEALVESLKVKTTPSTILYMPSLGRSVLEEGLRDTVYLDELINIVQGKVKR